MQDYNNNIIKEFHENEGKVGGPFAGAPMILITHTGAKSDTQRTNPSSTPRTATGTATSSPTPTPVLKSAPKSSTSSPKS